MSSPAINVGGAPASLDQGFSNPATHWGQRWGTFGGMVLLVAAAAGDVTVLATGVSASIAVGNTSVVGNANVSATGVASSVAMGDETVTAGAAVSALGVATTVAVGDAVVIAGAGASVTGVFASALVGSVTVVIGGGGDPSPPLTVVMPGSGGAVAASGPGVFDIYGRPVREGSNPPGPRFVRLRLADGTVVLKQI